MSRISLHRIYWSAEFVPAFILFNSAACFSSVPLNIIFAASKARTIFPLFSFNSSSWSLSSFRARSEFGPAAFKFALSSTNFDSQSRWAACVFSICSAASPLSFDISASWVRISFSWSDSSFGMDPFLFARAAGKKTCHTIKIKL